MVQGPILAGVTWWPHSGGRWLCRTLLGSHNSVAGATFVHPWLFFSTDMTLALDLTAQVHKARSLPELRSHLDALYSSVDHGRRAGLVSYFEQIAKNHQDTKKSHLVGEMCLGSPEPRPLDVAALFAARPDFRLIHLVRNPVDAYPSFSARNEMDGDPVRIAGSWRTLNAGIRLFFEKNPEHRGQYHMVRYEDLTSDMANSLEPVGDFLGLEFTETTVANSGERWGRNTTESADRDVKSIMQEIAGSELSMYGY